MAVRYQGADLAEGLNGYREELGEADDRDQLADRDGVFQRPFSGEQGDTGQEKPAESGGYCRS